ncbi:hypothetical protein MBLNU230_g6109t1 [Neophaeotheca triangularis]
MPSPTPAPGLTLHRGFPPAKVYVWSAFVTKVEFRLRHAGVAYETGAGGPREAPKGKIPYLEISSEGSGGGGGAEQVPDSAQIVRELEGRGLLPRVHEGLTGVERAGVKGLVALLEERLYFLSLYERWIENYYTQRDQVLWRLPYPVKVVVGLVIYRSMVSTLYGQGTGRHSDEERRAFSKEIWESLEEMLKQRFAESTVARDEPVWCLGGKQPTDADAALFGFIVSSLVAESGPATAEIVRGLPSVLDYASRIHERYFPDYERWT